MAVVIPVRHSRVFTLLYEYRPGMDGLPDAIGATDHFRAELLLAGVGLLPAAGRISPIAVYFRFVHFCNFP